MTGEKESEEWKKRKKKKTMGLNERGNDTMENRGKLQLYPGVKSKQIHKYVDK